MINNLQKVLTDQEIKDTQFVDSLFYNNGEFLTKENKIERQSISDIVTSKTYGELFKTQVENYIVKSIQPQTVIIDNLFQEIPVNPNIQSVTIRTFGALEAHEVGETGTAREQDPEYSNQGHKIKMDIKRWGLTLAMSEKAIKNDQWGVLKFWLREASNALARTKEKNAYKLINEGGITVFDNAGSSELGVATGRGQSGAQIGVPSFNDIVDTYAYLIARGFNPDVMIMHPFAWRMFLLDPNIREVFLKGAKIISNKPPKGDPFPGWADFFKGLGYKTVGTGDPFSNQLQALGNTFTAQPAALPAPMTIIITPRVPFEQMTVTGQGGSGSFGLKGVTDIMIADSSQCGAIAVAQRPNVRNWADIIKRTASWEITEEYDMDVLAQGKAIAIMRNMVVDKEANFQNVNNVTLSELNKTDYFTFS